ncbi:MAG TPA: ABC transporter permease, partial [Pyrinomonadaceae bacterium]|nr:ABC transporter permease [Pyrinomonadaceae bacterium]
MCNKLARRLRALFHKDELERELDEELRFHLEREVEENLRRGMSREEARRVAMVNFGGVERVKEECRDVRGVRLVEDLRQDLRYGLRTLRKNPGFALVAVVTLALGIGINTAVFTICYAVAWRPLPVKEPAGLVRVERVGAGGEHNETGSYPDYVYYRDHNQSFSGLLAYAGPAPLTMSVEAGANGESPSGAQAEVAQVAFVSGNYFSLLGGGSLVGHTFTPEEDRTPGTHPVAVISQGFWRRRFGGDPQVLGKTLTINNAELTVVGVAPQDFAGVTPIVPDVWIPLMMQNRVLPIFDNQDRGATFFRVLGRLKPGATLDEARSEFDVLASRIARAFPETNERVGVRLEAADSFSRLDGFLRTMFLLVTAATLMVLLIACANVANLLLTRANARRREIAIRLSLGASRGRLIRQLLTESLLLATLGGVAGLLMSMWTLDILLKLILSRLPAELGMVRVAFDLSPDLHIFLYTLLLSLVTGVAFGLAPAIQTTRPDLLAALKQSDSSFGQSLGRGVFGLSLRDLLVVGQVAVCLVLLVGAGLLVRGVLKAQTIAPGFETKRMLVVEPNLLTLGYDAARTDEMNRQLAARLESLPGVRSVALSTRTAGARKTGVASIAGQSATRESRLVNANYTMISPNYFETMNIPLARGRGFNEQETRARVPSSVVISEATARRIFGEGVDPLGQRLRIGNAPQGAGRKFEPEPYSPSCEVVGVAKDVRSVRLSETDAALVYLPLAPTNEVQVWLLVRTGVEPRGVVAQVRDEVQNFDRRIFPVVAPLEESLGQQLLPARVLSMLGGALGALGLLLASIGLYGVISYAVSQRTREIGIRMALGARRADVLRLIIGRGMLLVALGVALGVAGAAVLSRLLSSFLYGLSTLDPVAFVGVPALLAAVAMLSIYLPAR